MRLFFAFIRMIEVFIVILVTMWGFYKFLGYIAASDNWQFCDEARTKHYILSECNQAQEDKANE